MYELVWERWKGLMVPEPIYENSVLRTDSEVQGGLETNQRGAGRLP